MVQYDDDNPQYHWYSVNDECQLILAYCDEMSGLGTSCRDELCSIYGEPSDELLRATVDRWEAEFHKYCEWLRNK